MANLWGRFSMATRIAYREFMRVLSDPSGVQRRDAHKEIVGHYARRWARYSNDIFEDRAFWSSYLARHGMYRYTRPIYNPSRKLGDFYASIIYPGVLATDGKKLPDGTPLAIPLADDTPDALRAALGQLWQWSNWQDGMGLMTLYGAVLGDVLVEVQDELDRGKVTFDVVWPGRVTDLELDSTSNVKSYAIEYDAEDDEGKVYTYRKEVNDEWIAEYKDGEPFAYDENIAAIRPNPYGFAPAVWCRHQNNGTNYGMPALRNEHAPDELNSLASHAYDRAHAILSSPVLVSGASSNTMPVTAANEQKRASAIASSTSATDYSGRESIRFIAANEGANIASVELPEGEVAKRIEELWHSIEREHPELVMYEQLREMSQVTGPAAEILVGDTSNLVIRARATYDTQSIKLFQMAIAIAGWRAQNGDWGTLTRQQQVFTPFDLESYQAGELDFEIMPRPLIPRVALSPDERRAIMDEVERGFAVRAKAIDKLGGDSKTDMAIIDQERAAQEQANAATVQGVLDRVRQVQGTQPQEEGA